MTVTDSVAGDHRPQPGSRRRRPRWISPLSAIAVLAGVGIGVGAYALIQTPPKPPLRYEGSNQWNCFVRSGANAHDSYTLGLDALENTTSHPATVLSATGVLSSRMRLAQMYIAPWPLSEPGLDGVGTGFGLPSNPDDNAVGQTKIDREVWAHRQRVPGAVIGPSKPGVEDIVVIGLTRTPGTQPAYLRDFRIRYRAEGHTYTLEGFAYLYLPSKTGSPNGGCPASLNTAPDGGDIGHAGP